MPYPMATPEDLAETVKEVEALDRRIVATQADVRDYGALKAALDDGVAQLGRLDIVSRQRRDRFSFGPPEELDEDDVAGHDRRQPDRRVARGQGGHPAPARRGRRVDRPDQLDGGAAGDSRTSGHYTSAKHGVVGLMQTLALELAPDMIRVNSVHPDHGQHRHDPERRHLRAVRAGPAGGGAHRRTLAPRFQTLNALPIPWVEPVDISNAVLFLASDEARYITGVTLPVDAGSLAK